MTSNSSILEPKTKKDRLYLLDLLKLFSIISIVFFHFNEFLFDTDYHPLRPFTIIYRYFGVFCEFTSFSGQTIVSVFAFLVGYRFKNKIDKKQFSYFLGLFVFGYLLVNIGYYGESAFNKFYWDIYPFLAVSFLSLLIILPDIRVVKLGLILGIFLLVYPFQQFSLVSSDYSIWREIVFGYCNSSLKTSWPIIPWIGLVWLMGGLGYFARIEAINRTYLSKMGLIEKGTWMLVGFGSMISLKYFANAPYGDSLYCFVLQAPPLTEFGYLAFIIFVIRLSLISDVSHFCIQNSVSRFLLRSSWCQNFGLSYLVHLMILVLLGAFRDLVTSGPIAFDLAILSIFVSVELMVPILKNNLDRILLAGR